MAVQGIKSWQCLFSSNCFVVYRTSESSEECDDVSEKFTRSRCEPNVCGAENNKHDYVNETDVEEDEVDDDSGHLSSLPFLSVSDDNNKTISSRLGLPNERLSGRVVIALIDIS